MSDCSVARWQCGLWTNASVTKSGGCLRYVLQSGRDEVPQSVLRYYCEEAWKPVILRGRGEKEFDTHPYALTLTARGNHREQIMGILGLPFTLSGFLLALILATFGHEFGHLLVVKFFHIPVKSIAVGLGPAIWRRSLAGDVRFEVRALPISMAIGVARRRGADGRIRCPLQQDVAVAIAGPVANLLLSLSVLALALFARYAPELQSWLIATAILSLLVALLNLIPLPGLDGGHLFSSAWHVWGCRGHPNAKRRYTGLGCVWVLSPVYCYWPPASAALPESKLLAPQTP